MEIVKDIDGRKFEILESANEYAFLRVLEDDGNYKPYVVAYRIDKINGGWESGTHYEDFEEAKATYHQNTDFSQQG